MITAVLAAIPIADIDTRPLHCRLTSIASNVNIMPQADDRRNGKCRRRRMEHVVAVVLFDKHRAAKPQTHSTSNANRSERLVREIQK
jgi:DNA repair protein RadC